MDFPTISTYVCPPYEPVLNSDGYYFVVDPDGKGFDPDGKLDSDLQEELDIALQVFLDKFDEEEGDLIWMYDPVDDD